MHGDAVEVLGCPEFSRKVMVIQYIKVNVQGIVELIWFAHSSPEHRCQTDWSPYNQSARGSRRILFHESSIRAIPDSSA